MTIKHKGRGTGTFGKPRMLRPYCAFWNTRTSQPEIKRADKWDGWDVVRDADGNVVWAYRFDAD